MASSRFTRTVLGCVVTGVLLAMLWREADPWGSIGMIAMAPLMVIGFFSLQELARKPASRPYAVAIGLGLVAPLATALMAPHAARWTGIAVSGLCAIAGLLGTFYREQARNRA